MDRFGGFSPGAAVILDTETVGSDTETKVLSTPACVVAVIDACTGETLLSALINPKTPNDLVIDADQGQFDLGVDRAGLLRGRVRAGR
jgi:hypothetical protein